jgi:hypothetical protein
MNLIVLKVKVVLERRIKNQQKREENLEDNYL